MGKKIPGKQRLTARLGVMVGLCVVGSFGVPGTASVAAAQPSPHVVVLEDDGTLLDAPEPFPFSGLSLRFTPSGDGGYETRLGTSSEIEALGARLDFSSREVASVGVRLTEPLTLFGVEHDSLFVHRTGAVTFGAPLPAGVAARAAASDQLLEGLLSGPPVVAALWNELRPERAGRSGGVYLAQRPSEVVITWLDVPSVRPARAPNSFRMVLRRDGEVLLEYGRLATAWGIVGLSPGQRDGIGLVDFAAEPDVPAHVATLAWYRDLPVLNEIAVAHRLYEEVVDSFEFLTIFTTTPVDAPHLIGSTTVKSTEDGIGRQPFDQSWLLGSRKLEHIVLMNSISFYDPDPREPPRTPMYAYAPSTLGVLAHEVGHRWLSHAGEDSLATGDGHWGFPVGTDASLMGGNRLRANGDGSFTTTGVMEHFSPLDLYLMGLLPAAEVPPFFFVDDASDFRDEASGRPLDLRFDARPRAGVSFDGTRRDVSIRDVVDHAGPRVPAASGELQTYRMAFVIVTPAGRPVTSAERATVEHTRRRFSGFFRAATDGRARMKTWLNHRRERRAPRVDESLQAGVPQLLAARVGSRSDGATVVQVDFADFDADTTALEVRTDTTDGLPPSRLDVATDAAGRRRGTVAFVLLELPEGARQLQVALVDALGRRSSPAVFPLPSGE